MPSLTSMLRDRAYAFKGRDPLIEQAADEIERLEKLLETSQSWVAAAKESGATKRERGMDNVNHPSHYTWLEGVEVIDVAAQLNFTLGNAIKYILRCDHKGRAIEDLEKAVWYLNYEIKRRRQVSAAGRSGT